MGQRISPEKPSTKTEVKDTIFIYDLKSTVKQFLAGTSLENDVDHLTRYDDYEVIQYKRGLEIKSLTIYREDNKIVGLETVYKDNDNKELKLQRIAPKYKKSKLKNFQQLKLTYNEHLTDIDIVYTHDYIKYIEICTSKGNHLKIGTEVENGYTSVSRVEVQQKTYMAIVAFETTFSYDALKEIFIYRAPVRFSKRKKRTEMTVNEINRLKAAPNLNSLKKAQENIQKIRNVTMKSIMQLKALKTFQTLGKKQEESGSSHDQNSDSFGGTEPRPVKEENEEKGEKEDNYMEEEDFGIDHEANEDNEDEKEKKLDTPKKDPMKQVQFPGSSLLVNLFKRKDSQNSSNKDAQSKENSPALSSSSKKGPAKVFSFLRLDSLKKLVGINSPDTAKSNESPPKNKSLFSHEIERVSPYKDIKDSGLSREHLMLENTLSPSNNTLNARRKITIDEAFANWDSMGYESHPGSPARGSITSLKQKAFEFKSKVEPDSELNSKKIPLRDRLKMNLIAVKSGKKHENFKSQSPSSESGEETKDFSQAFKQYEITNKITQDLTDAKNSQSDLLMSSVHSKRDIRRKISNEIGSPKSKLGFNPFKHSREIILEPAVRKESLHSSTKKAPNDLESGTKRSNEKVSQGVGQKRTLRKMTEDNKLEILNSIRARDFISPGHDNSVMEEET